VRLYRSEEGRAEVCAWCERRFDEVDGLEREMVPTALGPTHLLTTGAGSRLLVLPGNNMNGAAMVGFVAALATDHQVTMADLPGQPGLSAPERPRGDRMAAYGAWVDELLAGAVPGPVLLVGHSLGAAVALSATPSGRIGGVALLSPAGLARVRLTRRVLTTSTAWMVRPDPGRSAALVTLMQSPGRPADPILTEWFTLVGRHTRSVGAPGPRPESVVRRWRDRPVTVVTGADDVFFPPGRLTRPTQARLGVDVVTVEGAGHLLPHEDPAATADAIRAVAR
jgi:pimeloyl-ACP methyl ester carboxylesterase